MDEEVPIQPERTNRVSQIGVIGTSFKVAPISVREDLTRTVTMERLAELKAMRKYELGDVELVLLSTCNRTEIYYSGNRLSSEVPGILKNLLGSQGEFKFYHLTGHSAISHLFEVAAGLDSLVIGEAQILSQVREASRLSEERGLSGPILSKLFSKACYNGREIRAEGSEFIGDMNNSVSLAVLKLITNRFRDKRPNLLLVGSGKMIRLASNSLDRSRFGRVVVAARRQEINGVNADATIPLSEISRVLCEEEIDAVVTATSSDSYILQHHDLEQAISKRKSPLLILDISVPRNVDPLVANIPIVTLVNIDDLAEHIEPPGPEEAEQISRLKGSISSKSREFASWALEYNEIVPLLAALRKRAEVIRSEELENALSRLPNLTPSQRAVIEKMTERLIRRFLHEPTIKLKQLARDEEDKRAKEYTEAILELFSPVVSEQDMQPIALKNSISEE